VRNGKIWKCWKILGKLGVVKKVARSSKKIAYGVTGRKTEPLDRARPVGNIWHLWENLPNLVNLRIWSKNWINWKNLEMPPSAADIGRRNYEQIYHQM